MGAAQRSQPLCCVVPREEFWWYESQISDGRDSTNVFFDVQHGVGKFFKISAVGGSSLIRIGRKRKKIDPAFCFNRDRPLLIRETFRWNQSLPWSSHMSDLRFAPFDKIDRSMDAAAASFEQNFP